MKLIVTGPRVFTDRGKFLEGMQTVPSKPRIKSLVTAGCYGVEALAKAYCTEVGTGMKWKLVRPNYKKHGSLAYHKNHKHMIEAGDAALVFTDNLCHYTHGFLLECDKRGFPYITFDISGYTR